MLDRIHYISQGNSAQEHFDAIKTVLEAGGRLIQLRFKDKEAILPLAEKVKSLCDEYNATLIINDFVEVVNAVDADGVHLGLGDGSVAEARAILGAEKVIGGTANTLQDVLQRIEEGCDYIGLGPFRFTNTKKNLSPILGVEGYDAILNELNDDVKIYAIGGIEVGDVPSIIGTGIYGIAVSGLLTKGVETKNNYTELKNRIDESIKDC